MPALYDKLGIRFQYPDNWTLDEQDAASGEGAVSVYSEGGAFWSISSYSPLTDPEDLAETALAAMKEEYQGLESEPVHETIAGHELVGYDLNFFWLDLVNTGRIRVIPTTQANYVVLCQAEDKEFRVAGQVFSAITTSLLM
jgi:hypothetical protein